MKRNKIKGDKRKEEEISRQNIWRDEKVKRMRKVGESVNVKKEMSTI